MDIDLLDDDAPIDAETWNDLFTELDAKLSTLLDSKNLILIGAHVPAVDLRPILGMLFFFVDGPRLLSATFGGRDYNHEPFTAAARDLDLASPDPIFDAAAKIVQLADPVPDALYRDEVDMGTSAHFFDRSLEAHRRLHGGEMHWIIEPIVGEPSYRPQKIYHYGLAEIIVEGERFRSAPLRIEEHWNKFNCFRIHNCNPYSITVEFGSSHTVIVPRWESRCVRRTTATTGYVTGLKYFQTFRSGDPRCFYMPQGNDTPALSMGANNILSPFIAYRYIEAFRTLTAGTPGAPTWFVDPHALYDVAALYEDYFPAIASGTLIGDLLHHRGTIRRVKVDGSTITTEDIAFTGYADLLQNAPGLGLTLTENANGSLSIEATDSAASYDLWGLSTNILNTPTSVRPAVGIDDPAALTNHAPSALEASVRPVLAETESRAPYYRALGPINAAGEVPLAEIVPSPIAWTTLRFLGNAEDDYGEPFRPHAHTVADVLRLDPWSPRNHVLDNAYATFTDHALTLTPWGLTLTWAVDLPLNHRASDILGSNIIDATLGPAATNAAADVVLEETSLRFLRSLTFSGYGWAASVSQPAFIGPRAPRLVATLPSQVVSYVVGAPAFLPEEIRLGLPIRYHANLLDQPFGPDGTDFDFSPITRAQDQREATRIRSLTALTPSAPHGLSEGDPSDFQVYANPDVLAEFLERGTSDYLTYRASYLDNRTDHFPARMIWLNLLREHYNALAQRINAITRARPFHFAAVTHVFEGARVAALTPNLIGPYAGPYCPANQYCSFAKNSQTYRLCQHLGIPIKTAADLPASYQALANTVKNSWIIETQFRQVNTLRSPNPVPVGGGVTVWEMHAVQTLLGTAMRRDRNIASGDMIDHTTFDGTRANTLEFYWVTVEDVQTATEALGFLFHLERAVTPYYLARFEPHAIARLHATATTLEFDFDDIASSPGSGFPLPTFPVFNPNPPVGTFTRTASLPFNVRVTDFALFVQAETLAEAAWVREVTNYQIAAVTPGDVATVEHGPLEPFRADPMAVTVVYEITYIEPATEIAETRWRRESAVLTRDDTGSESILPADQVIPPAVSLLYQSWLSESLTRSSQAIQIPTPYLSHEADDFSRAGLAEAIGRLAHGAGVLPLQLVPASGATTATQLDSAATLLPGPATAYDVLVFRDWPLSI